MLELLHMMQGRDEGHEIVCFCGKRDMIDILAQKSCAIFNTEPSCLFARGFKCNRANLVEVELLNCAAGEEPQL